MNKKHLAITSAAFVLVAAMSIKPAMAYFTSTQTAEGVVAVSVGDASIETNEEVSNMVKTISIANNSAFDCYIRVKAISSSEYSVDLDDVKESKDWKFSDGYYYYSPIVAAGQSTGALNLKISVPENSSLKNADFNVIIVSESTKVHYNDEHPDGFADWAEVIATNTDNSNAQVEVTETNDQQPEGGN